MSDSVYLIGADDVRSAGHSMRSAAEQMSQAALNIDGTMERHQRFLEDWLMRFEDVMTRSVQPQAVVVIPPAAPALPSGGAETCDDCDYSTGYRCKRHR